MIIFNFALYLHGHSVLSQGYLHVKPNYLLSLLINQAIEYVKEYSRSNGTSFDDVSLIGKLREMGFGKVETIKILLEAFSAPFPIIKNTVHGSAAWLDRKESDDALHDSVEQDLKSI